MNVKNGGENKMHDPKGSWDNIRGSGGSNYGLYWPRVLKVTPRKLTV
jgi:hypothetical protein